MSRSTAVAMAATAPSSVVSAAKPRTRRLGGAGQVIRHPDGLVGVARHQDHVGTLGREQPRGRQPDAACASGDHRHLAPQSQVHAPRSFSRGRTYHRRRVSASETHRNSAERSGGEVRSGTSASKQGKTNDRSGLGPAAGTARKRRSRWCRSPCATSRPGSPTQSMSHRDLSGPHAPYRQGVVRRSPGTRLDYSVRSPVSMVSSMRRCSIPPP